MNVTVMVDASFCPITGAGGYGAWIASGRGRLPFEGQFLEPLDNSTLAEMAAVVNALHCGIKCGCIVKGDFVLVQSDCTAAIQSFIGGRGIAHCMERKILEAYTRLKVNFELDIKFKHVKAHTGNLDRRSRSNHVCDQRAYRQMKLMRQRLKLAEIRKLIGE